MFNTPEEKHVDSMVPSWLQFTSKVSPLPRNSSLRDPSSRDHTHT